LGAFPEIAGKCESLLAALPHAPEPESTLPKSLQTVIYRTFQPTKQGILSMLLLRIGGIGVRNPGSGGLIPESNALSPKMIRTANRLTSACSLK
jgi:hypothetical protein